MGLDTEIDTMGSCSRNLTVAHAIRTLLAVAILIFGSAKPSAQVPNLRLLDAVKQQDAGAVRLLLDAAADVNAAQADGATALHWAVYFDDLELARLLLDAGADTGAANTHGVVPLALACTNANAAMVDLLLAVGADAVAAVTTGETVLMGCARTGNAAAVAASSTTARMSTRPSPKSIRPP